MIFADSSSWRVLGNRDANHDAARRLLDENSEEQLIITNHLRGERPAKLRRRVSLRRSSCHAESSSPTWSGYRL